MKNSLLIGAVLGVVTATAIYTASNQNLVKKTKKVLLTSWKTCLTDRADGFCRKSCGIVR